MGLYEIALKGRIESDLRKIDRQYITKILDAIGSLAKNPFPVQSRKLRNSESSYRLRVGEYRAIYRVDMENKVVTIYHVGHRKDAYKALS
jgi:mRNA interferase RelE/StbE